MARSGPIWAILINNVGCMLLAVTLAVYLPTYFAAVLRLRLTSVSGILCRRQKSMKRVGFEPTPRRTSALS